MNIFFNIKFRKVGMIGMKTNTAYIHEYSMLDDINETLSDAITSINEASYEYDRAKRDFELKTFFEDSSPDLFTEAEKAGIFERIGNAIIKIIKKIGEVLSKFTDKFLHRSKEIQTDEEIVNQIATEHPELKSTICKGINKEWFTYRDIAKYQKDIIGLTNMLEQQTIDHRTFKEKCSEAFNNFNKSGTAIIATGTTIVGLLSIVPKVHSAFQKNKKVLNESKGILEKLKSKIGANKSKDDALGFVKESTGSLSPEIVSVIVKEFSKAVSVITGELNRVIASQGNIGEVLKNFINEHK